MTEKLPISAKNHALDNSASRSGSLLGRGLATIQNKKSDITLLDLDSRYRQARDIYNRVIYYGWKHPRKVLLFEQIDLFESELFLLFRQPKKFECSQLTNYGWDNRFISDGQNDLFENDFLYKLQPLQLLKNVFKTFQQLASEDYGKAYFPLANMYQGKQGVKQQIDKANDYGKLAFDWCFKNLTENDAEIWGDLASMYCYGQGVSLNYEEAAFWYYKAARQGNAIAQCNLGWMYDYRTGLCESRKMAVFWYQKAAEQGLAHAQFNLGCIYEGYSSGSTNYEEAIFWYRKAAEQGHAIAQCNLGFLLCVIEGGDGEDEAVYWYQQAAKQGYVKAQEKLTELDVN